MKNVEIMRKSIDNLNQNTNSIRVAAYIRVSTDEKVQENSFDSQKKYYIDKISKNPSWKFCGIYGDEGISGTNVKNRTGFITLMNEALNGNIDLIITKSVSRFARNTIDTLEFIRRLKEKNVAVIFEEENINTRTMQGEFLITVLSSISQQESENISAHIIAGRDMGIRNNNYKIPILGYGYIYNKKKGTIDINEDEAVIINKMFDWFIEGKTVRYVFEKLKENNIKSPTGKDVWRMLTIRNILKNEKYIGDKLLLKSIVINPITHQRIKNKGYRDQYYIHEHHTPIILSDKFFKVQKIFEENERDISKYSLPKRHLLAYMSNCGFCNTVLRPIEKITNSSNTYLCKRHAEPNHFDYKCEISRKVKEEDIKICFNKIISKFKKQIKFSDYDKMIDNKLFYAKQLLMEEIENGKLKEKIFNENLFRNIIQNVTIGGYDEQDNLNPYLIRFILKDNGFDNKIMNNYVAKNKKTKIILKDRYFSKLKYRYRDKNIQKEIDEIGVEFEITLEIINEDSLIWKL